MVLETFDQIDEETWPGSCDISEDLVRSQKECEISVDLVRSQLRYVVL